MKFGLGPLENSRTFYSPKGNQTIIRDTVNPQFNIPQPTLVNETEPEIEVIISEEPTLEIIAEIPAPKKTKKPNERPPEN
jgi:hypothetical protein